MTSSSIFLALLSNSTFFLIVFIFRPYLYPNFFSLIPAFTVNSYRQIFFLDFALHFFDILLFYCSSFQYFFTSVFLPPTNSYYSPSWLLLPLPASNSLPLTFHCFFIHRNLCPLDYSTIPSPFVLENLLLFSKIYLFLQPYHFHNSPFFGILSFSYFSRFSLWRIK